MASEMTRHLLSLAIKSSQDDTYVDIALLGIINSNVLVLCRETTPESIIKGYGFLCAFREGCQVVDIPRLQPLIEKIEPYETAIKVIHESYFFALDFCNGYLPNYTKMSQEIKTLQISYEVLHNLLRLEDTTIGVYIDLKVPDRLGTFTNLSNFPKLMAENLFRVADFLNYGIVN